MVRYASGAISQLYIRSNDLVVHVVVYIFLFSEERPLLNMPESTMSVPSEAVPAIIGCEGSKIKDTCAVFNTSIDIDKTDDPLSYVTIRAYSEVAIERTKQILPMAVKHYWASVEVLPANGDIPTKPNYADAFQEVKTFSFETFMRN